MPLDRTSQLIDLLRQLRLLTAEEIEDLQRRQGQYATPRDLASYLIKQDLLSPYQVNLIFLDRGPELAVGSYILLERLGEGGMGTVYKARHVTMDRLVAVKVIRKERLRSSDAVRRFEREIKAAAQLSHPNIVLAFDADKVDDTFVFVMEFVEGTDLAKLVKQSGPLPVSQSCDYLRQAALGLQHAHERGMVHRDIKPHNLILTPTGVIKILDFGLVRMADGEEHSDPTSMTETGQLLGTLDYMAPEQAAASHDVDIRADLYSLGCTLYFLLAGRPPFPGGSVVQKIRRHSQEDPVALESLRKDVPSAVANVVRKLMAKRPVDRYQTPAELVGVLEASSRRADTKKLDLPQDVPLDKTHQLLVQSRLLQPGELQAAQRWLSDNAGRTGSDLCQWLVGQQLLTEYQAKLILRGQVNNLFLGDYRLLDRIGQGKMAGVFQAVHRLGQEVAIKVLPPSKAQDANSLARFQREGRLAQRLKHPNLIRTHHLAVHKGLHYIVMEYLEGESFDELLQRRGQLPPVEAVQLVYQALLGVQHLQGLGIVHRDLKPENLMIVPTSNGQSPSQVKILDIGLGRELFDEENLTKAGTLLGSPSYIAPEQAVDAHAVDSRADIYSLGCVLYRALTGHEPFADKHVVRQIIRHATEAAKPLSEFLEAPAVLQHIVATMMAKDPAQRYPTAAAAAKALRVFLHSETSPIHTPQPARVLPAYQTWLDSTPGSGEETVDGPAAVPEEPFHFDAAPPAEPPLAILVSSGPPNAPVATLLSTDPPNPRPSRASGLLRLLRRLFGQN